MIGEESMNEVTKLRVFRVIANLKQRELAEKVGITQSLISLLETKKIFPGEELQKKIAAALNEPKDQVFPKR